VPGADDEVAVVVHVGEVVSVNDPDGLSEYEGVIAGTVPPKFIDPLDAVTVSTGSLTFVDPGLGAAVTVKSLQLLPVVWPSGSRTMLSPGAAVAGAMGALQPSAKYLTEEPQPTPSTVVPEELTMAPS
jgi:hypothetical protein